MHGHLDDLVAMDINTDAPPPYSPIIPGTAHTPQRQPTLPTLPLHILHLVLSYVLDPLATPSRWYTSIEEELPRRRYALFRGVRPVCRPLRRVAMAILRQHYLPAYTRGLSIGCTADPMSPLPLAAHSTDPGSSNGGATEKGPSLLRAETQAQTDGDRRETRVLDRFIAIRLGLELRAAESALTEDDSPDSLRDLFTRVQPAARVEDLLCALPPELVNVQRSMGPVSRHGLPLPWDHAGVVLTPGWCQLYIAPLPLTANGGAHPGERRGREVVLEVRRGRSCEETAANVAAGLGAMCWGEVRWGDRWIG